MSATGLAPRSRCWRAGSPACSTTSAAARRSRTSSSAERIVALVGASDDLITFVPDRPGHDFRYGVTDERVRGLGWAPEIGFDDGLAETVAWYRDNRDWLYRAHDVDVVTRPRPPRGVA